MYLISSRFIRRYSKPRYYCKRDLLISWLIVIIFLLTISFNLEKSYSFIQKHHSSFYSLYSTPIAKRTLIIVRTSHHCESRLKYLLTSWISRYKDKQNQQNIFLLTDHYIKNSSYDKFANVILTNCPQTHNKFDLCCKTANEFEFYYNVTKDNNQFDWMCRFDDDQYLNLDNLYSYLGELDSSIPYYIGRTSTHPLGIHGLKQKFRFATYGGGVCYSKVLLKKLRLYINKSITPNECVKTGLSDDAYMGYTIEHKLNVSLTVLNDRLHSHLEHLDISFRRLTLQNLLQAITFGFAWDRYQLSWMPIIHEIIQLAKQNLNNEHSLMLLWNFLRDYEKLHPENLTEKFDDSCTSYHKRVKAAKTPSKTQQLTTRITPVEKITVKKIV